jgi:thiamine biosynthesis lipoprotein
VFVIGDSAQRSAAEAVESARAQMLEWHREFTRFDAGSELSRLNADPRAEVPASPAMLRFAELVQRAAEMSGGLVDATLVTEIEAAGYVADLPSPVPLTQALEAAPAPRPAAPSRASRWRLLGVDPARAVVIRPPGLRLDSGGLAKGLFCDLLGERLAPHAAFAIDCAGDVLVGGAAGTVRAIQVASPFDESVLYTLETEAMAAATSGIGRRSWVDRDGRAAHHLLDPSSGRPAFTGVVQATAFAPSAALAEVYAKAAILSGPSAAAGWLPHGGVVVTDDGGHLVVEPG